MIKELFGWIIKLNPAQRAIYANEYSAPPEPITDVITAYDDIEIINRAVDMIVSGCVEIPFSIEFGSGPAKKVNKLLNENPNPFEDRFKFFRRAFLDYILDGNAFFYYDENNIFLLPANDVEIIADPKTFISHFEYTLLSPDNAMENFLIGRNSSSYKNKDKRAIIFDANEIIHIKADNSTSIYRGKSKLASLERIINVYYALISFQQQFFQNNAIPGIVLTTDNVLNTKIKDRMLQQWKEAYRSIFSGARNPAILDGGLKIDNFSKINFQELDFENSIDRLQQDMSKALGVPYVLLKSGNNANISQNQILFYTHTIMPILEQFASAFGHKFSLKIVPDQLAVKALRPDAKVQASFWSTLVNGGIATVNEAREGLRLEKMNDGESDKIRIPQNIAGSATNPNIGGRPPSEPNSDEEGN